MTAGSSDQWSIQSTNVIITAIIIMLSPIIMVFALREDSENLKFPFGKNQEEKGNVSRTGVTVGMEKKKICGIESRIRG